MEPASLVSWQTLATYSGAAAATALIVQFTKGVIDRWVHLPTQLYSYLVAVLILFAAGFFTGTLTAANAALTLVNGILVAVASNGTFGAAKAVKNAAELQGWERKD